MTHGGIDCAGILKLRNSDIELRKGETDIGRKNTRVRMVFRVHINQANGRTVSLQAASNPIECSQRSAQELPLVDRQSMESCPASGGERMVLSGHNFQPDSKVVFVEKAQDGGISESSPSYVLHCQTICSQLSFRSGIPLQIVILSKWDQIGLKSYSVGPALALHPRNRSKDALPRAKKSRPLPCKWNARLLSCTVRETLKNSYFLSRRLENLLKMCPTKPLCMETPP
ncbi:hypothetical protein NFI96_006725 [Prochilodus magdalenae]|nr:hypothetical protein NFI96_006725 [Prochilodus magdalenae]